jgi:hypothetical protein
MRMSLVTEVAPPHTLPPGTIANSAPCTHLTLGYSPKLVERLSGNSVGEASTRPDHSPSTRKMGSSPLYAGLRRPDLGPVGTFQTVRRRGFLGSMLAAGRIPMR